MFSLSLSSLSYFYGTTTKKQEGSERKEHEEYVSTRRGCTCHKLTHTHTRAQTQLLYWTPLLNLCCKALPNCEIWAEAAEEDGTEGGRC